MNLSRTIKIGIGALVVVAVLALVLLRHHEVPVFEERCDFHPLTEQEYQARFHDLQPAHFASARRKGIRPMDNSESVETVVREGQLVRVRSNTRYYLHDVSLPYLVPEAKALLDTIGERYHEYCHRPLRVTSCLRTSETVKKIQKNNVNAVSNSAHLYGTTFDISYALLNPQRKAALAHVLKQLQAEGKCCVKYEVKQPCFHITCR